MKNIIESRFYILHPLALLLYFIILFTCTILFSNPIYLLSISIITLSLVLYYTNTKEIALNLKTFLFVGFLFFILNPLTIHEGTHVLFYLLGQPITLEATTYGLYAMILIITMFMIFIVLNFIINNERFLYLFSKITPQISFTISLTLRYITLFTKRLKEIIDVQKTRGTHIKNIDSKFSLNNIKQKVTQIGTSLKSLLSWSLEEGMTTAEVLKAKNYGTCKRTNYTLFTKNTTDKIMITIYSISIIAIIGLRIIGVGGYSYYPTLLNPLQSTMDIYGLLFIILILISPHLLDIGLTIKRGVIRATTTN